MRVLVVSDSHGDYFSIYSAIEQQPTAKLVIHLGDGADDFDSIGNAYPNKRFLQVRGNCDWTSDLPLSIVEQVNKKNIFCTHGHMQGVKRTNQQLIEQAKSLGAHIALYGHTHQSVTDYTDGLYLMNPGSIRNGSYGIIDITDSGIVCFHVNIK